MNLDKAHDYIITNLPALCAEVIDWKHTGLLHGGEGGQLREVAGLLPDGVDSLRLAETMVADEAMEQIAHAQLGREEGELAEWRRIKGLFREEEKYRRFGLHAGCYHGHAHTIAGIWDSDNGPLAGHECAACAAARAALDGKETK